MKVITGIVESGRVEIPTGALLDGARVAVLAPESEEPVVLSAAENAELEAAVNDLRRGDFIEGSELLSQLRARSQD